MLKKNRSFDIGCIVKWCVVIKLGFEILNAIFFDIFDENALNPPKKQIRKQKKEPLGSQI